MDGVTQGARIFDLAFNTWYNPSTYFAIQHYGVSGENLTLPLAHRRLQTFALAGASGGEHQKYGAN